MLHQQTVKQGEVSLSHRCFCEKNKSTQNIIYNISMYKLSFDKKKEQQLQMILEEIMLIYNEEFILLFSYLIQKYDIQNTR